MTTDFISASKYASTDTDITVEIQRQLTTQIDCPADENIRGWAQAALGKTQSANTELTIRIVEREEIQASNMQWRGSDKPTNVLSFPANFPAQAGISYLGDIVICADVLQHESIEQQKTLADHWAHIVVHGVLHLQGHDHETEADAALMEKREKEILATLGVSDPYRDDPGYAVKASTGNADS